MNNQDGKLEFKIEDVVDGEKVSLDYVPVSMLKKFVDDVATLLGDAKNSIMQVKTGSVTLTADTTDEKVAQAEYDIERLFDGILADPLSQKRSAILNRWQAEANRHPDRIYSISRFSSNTNESKHFTISAVTKFKPPQPVIVDVERYMFGELTDWGGSNEANVHLRLESGETIIVSAKHEQIEQERENKVYKKQLLRVRAKQNKITKKLQDFELLSFEPYEPKFDDEEFTKLTKKGRKAWKDIDASGWVERQRGGDK